MQEESQRPLILVIDDDVGIREAIVDLLDEEGFATASASNGLEALNFIAESPQKPALIFLDLMMPTLDGWTFCKIRQATQVLMNIPVIAISAASMTGSHEPLRVEAMLSKPFDPDALTWLAASLLARKQTSETS
jgi:CheY-like chemotaxis protein